MNYRNLWYYLSATVLIVAVFMVVPAVIALCEGDYSTCLAFALTMAGAAGISLPGFLKKNKNRSLRSREGFILVALAWVLVSLIGALPLYFSKQVPGFVNCLFEIASGFTTTGATVIGDVEALPKSILYWRSFTHWLGGMGVLVFLLAISPTSSGDGLRIMRAESTGPEVNKLTPKTRQSARILYGIYIGMTLLQFLFMLFGGIGVFDALLLTFATAGTGGFSLKNDSLVSYSPYIQWVVGIFMLLFAVNFGVYYLLLMKQPKKALLNEELRFFLITVVCATALMTIHILPALNGNFSEALRHGFFQVITITSSAGFMTMDYNLWAPVCKAVIVLLMLIGACAGSTGGGIKFSRVLILFKSIRAEIQRLLHPNAVVRVRLDRETVSPQTVTNVFAFVGAYGLLTILSVLIISFDGFSLESNLTAVISCLSNIGPGLDAFGPTQTFAVFSDLSKLVLTFDMITGRLEIFPVLLMLIPSSWKKGRG